MTNAVSNCVFTTIIDVSGDVQSSVGFQLQLFHATQAHNRVLWFGVRSLLIAGLVWLTFERLTARRYVNDILRNSTVLPFHLLHPWLTFYHDDSQRHMAHVALNCLQAFRTVLWPAWLTDVCPIENIWDVMKRWMQASRKFDDLAKQWETIWQKSLRTPSGNFINLCHAGWELASRPEVTPYWFPSFVVVKL